MQISVLVYFFCFFIFLFCLYILARDDFIFLRRNLSTEKIFDLAFIALGVGLFFARVFYVAFNFSSNYLNLLAFLLFPYFPGLSLAGGILASLIFVLVFLKKSKIPQNRLFDFFMISFLCALPFGFLFDILLSILSKKSVGISAILEVLIYAILFVAVFRIFQKVKMEEGSIGFLSLGSFSLISIIFNVIEGWKKTLFFAKGDNFLFLFLFLISCVFLIKQENLLAKFKK